MRRALLLLTLIAIVGVLPAPVRADSAPAPSLEEVLQRFAAAQQATETLQAHFQERKELALLKEPVVQQGTFYHSKPDLYLWDYQAPATKQILLTPEVLLAYYPELNKAEEVNVRRWTSRIRRYLGVGEDPEALRQDYDIELGGSADNKIAGTDLLILRPKQKKLKERLDEVRIWVDRKTGQARQVAYLDADGDRTTFSFSDIKVNETIAASRYEIQLPRDVQMGDRFTGFSGR